MADDDTKSQDERDAANLAAFVEKITPKLAESVLESVTKSVETQIGGVLRKNSQLLAELAEAKKKEPAPTDPNAPILLSKEDARDPQKYRQARERAAKAGVAVHIEGRHSDVA